MKKNKYVYLYVLQGNYGYHGFEDLISSESYKEIKKSLKDYRVNEGGKYRIICRCKINK